jgi:transposase
MAGGRAAGAAQRRPTGPRPRLSDQQLDLIDQALWQGARAHGFDNDHWTLERVATVIERLTGVAYHRGHVWKLLRHRLRRPARRAVERGIQRIRATHWLPYWFLRHCGLSLWA